MPVPSRNLPGRRFMLANQALRPCASAQTQTFGRRTLPHWQIPGLGARLNAIIAGRFTEQTSAEKAAAALVVAGFHRDQVATFFVNAAGQHDFHGTHQGQWDGFDPLSAPMLA